MSAPSPRPYGQRTLAAIAVGVGVLTVALALWEVALCVAAALTPYTP